MTDRFIIDERAGCIAILDTENAIHKERSKELHPEDEDVVYFRTGESTVSIPDSIRIQAELVLDSVNKSPKLANVFVGLHCRYIQMMKRLHGQYEQRVVMGKKLQEIKDILN